MHSSERTTLIASALLLLAVTAGHAQQRPARVPIQGDIIGCVLPSDECKNGTIVRLKAGDRELELSVLNILQITNQLSVPQILTELRRFHQTAIAPKETLAKLVAPKPLKIRAVIRMEARTLMVTLVEPASDVDMKISE